MVKSLKSVMHGQCDPRPMVTFPAAGHHRPLTSTKLYCLVTEARVWTTCQWLLRQAEQLRFEPATFCVTSHSALYACMVSGVDEQGGSTTDLPATPPVLTGICITGWRHSLTGLLLTSSHTFICVVCLCCCEWGWGPVQWQQSKQDICINQRTPI